MQFLDCAVFEMKCEEVVLFATGIKFHTNQTEPADECGLALL